VPVVHEALPPAVKVVENVPDAPDPLAEAEAT